MSTDITNTNLPAQGDATNEAAHTEAAPASSNATPIAPVADDADDDLQPAFLAGAAPPRRVSPSVAETAWDDDDGEPGDDIGNRIHGPAHHERTTTEDDAAADAKKTRPRRNKGKPSVDPQQLPQDALPAQDDGEAAAASKRPPRPAKQPNTQHRERPAFRIGEEVFGKVVVVLNDAIVVDLSSKAQAIFDRHELAPDAVPRIGDHFVAIIHGDGARGGLVVLTQNPDRIDAAKLAVEAAAASGEPVLGLVTGAIKGGIEVDVSGLRAFAPASHVDLRLGAELTHLVGDRFPFKVMTYAKNGREVILSRRDTLEHDAASARREALARLEPDSVVQAVVRSIVEWGVFVAIPSADNVEGLVHATEATHDRNARLQSLFKVGDTIDVKVLRIDDKGKLWLSHRAASVDPWAATAETFAPGTRHKGRVARMQPFGVFVELAPNVDGLIRTVDLSMRRINDPSEVVKLGDEIDVVVVHVDAGQRKIALHPAPSEADGEPPQRVAMHRSVRVAVVTTEPAGLIVRVLGQTGAGARGFVPAGHTGTARGTDLRKEFPVGTVLEAKVIELDNRRGECKLSVRALKEDSEKAAYSEYRAKVARESKFGTFGDLFAKRGGS